MKSRPLPTKGCVHINGKVKSWIFDSHCAWFTIEASRVDANDVIELRQKELLGIGYLLYGQPKVMS